MIYQRLFETANTPVLIISQDFKIIDCNQAACILFGSSEKDLIGKSPIDISPQYQRNGKSSKEYAKQLFESLMKGDDQVFQWVHNKKDKSELFVEISLFGYDAYGNENFFGVFRDLTDSQLVESCKI